jgi:pimeloyl-ACP methyl ester carboxylesterase
MASAVAIFVHGFLSSAAVWSDVRGLMENDPDLTGYERMYFTYSSPRFVVNPARRIPAIDDVADSLRAFLLDETKRFDRIVLVGHSQGGLVIQRMLARALQDGMGGELRRIRRIILFACPNSGSEFLLVLRRGLFLIGRNYQDRELRPLSRAVAETHRRIINNVLHATHVSDNACPIPFAVYAGDSDRVVYHESASGMFPSAFVLPGDHKTIVRPKSRDDRTYVALRQQLLSALTEPYPLTREEQILQEKQAATSQFYELETLTRNPISIRMSATVTCNFVVHAGPVDKLRDIDIIVCPENSYMQMAHFFRPSISGRLRLAGAERNAAGEIIKDTIHDELNNWLREYGKFGLPVPPGTVAPTSSGELSSRGIRTIYHSAVASPREGEREYDVNPNVVSRVVHESFVLGRKERNAGEERRSICFPLLGAGSGGLEPNLSFNRIWAALEDELRGDGAWQIHFIEWRREHAGMLMAELEQRRASGFAKWGP